MYNSKNLEKRLPLILSSISVIIAFLSFMFSYWAYQNSQEEELNFVISSFYEDEQYCTLKKSKNSNDIGELSFPFECFVSNVGNKKLSIINTEVMYKLPTKNPLLKEIVINDFSPFGYRSEFFKKDGEKINYPLLLDVGESRRLFFNINVPINDTLFKLLIKSFNIDSTYTTDSLNNFFNRNYNTYNKEYFYSPSIPQIDYDYINSDLLPSDIVGGFLRIRFFTGKGNSFGSKPYLFYKF